MRSPTIGLALSPDRIATTAWSRTLVPWIAGAGEWEDLQAALAELRDALKLRAPRAAIALLPPLVHSRLLEFPRLAGVEYARVLTRDAARYFPTGRAAQIAAAEPVGGASGLVLGAAAASDLIAAVVAATQAAGWRLDTIVPAEYPGRARHIHVKVQAPRRRLLTTQLYFPGEPGNRRELFGSGFQEPAVAELAVLRVFLILRQDEGTG